MAKTTNISTRLANFFFFSVHTSFRYLTLPESGRKGGRGEKSRALHFIYGFSFSLRDRVARRWMTAGGTLQQQTDNGGQHGTVTGSSELGVSRESPLL